MRKISLLFVLITVALLSSCVDDKESATVEQIRTAKTEWLKAQAEMLKAQGEAQKLLAEIEKLKVENEAKNETARLEIERLIAEANAAKTLATAAMAKIGPTNGILAIADAAPVPATAVFAATCVPCTVHNAKICGIAAPIA